MAMLLSENKTIDPGLEKELLTRINAIPIVSAMDIKIEQFYEGRCIGVMPHKSETDGIFESYHGGLLMTAADTLACFALMTQTGADAYMATTDMNIRFLAPCLTDVRVDAKVIKFGKTICPVHVDLYDTQNKLVAVAQVTYIRLPGKPSR